MSCGHWSELAAELGIAGYSERQAEQHDRERSKFRELVARYGLGRFAKRTLKQLHSIQTAAQLAIDFGKETLAAIGRKRIEHNSNRSTFATQVPAAVSSAAMALEPTTTPVNKTSIITNQILGLIPNGIGILLMKSSRNGLGLVERIYSLSICLSNPQCKLEGYW